MKSLLTKILFISLLFSAVAPAIGENKEIASPEVTEAEAELLADIVVNTVAIAAVSYVAYINKRKIGIAVAGYAAYKAYRSEKVRNNLARLFEKAKNAWDNSSKYVRYGIPALYAGAVLKGYALSPSEIKDALSLAWQLKNWKVPVIAWKVKLARSA